MTPDYSLLISEHGKIVGSEGDLQKFLGTGFGALADKHITDLFRSQDRQRIREATSEQSGGSAESLSGMSVQYHPSGLIKTDVIVRVESEDLIRLEFSRPGSASDPFPKTTDKRHRPCTVIHREVFIDQAEDILLRDNSLHGDGLIDEAEFGLRPSVRQRTSSRRSTRSDFDADRGIKMAFVLQKRRSAAANSAPL